MIRLAYATLLGLIGAAVVHVAIVLLLPRLSANTAWNAVAELTQVNDPVEIGPDGDARAGALTKRLDPYFRKFVCRYDLSRGAVRVYSASRVPMWTAGVHDTLGTSIFSANDRITVRGELDLAIVNPRQLRLVRQSPPDTLSNAVVVPATSDRGFVVVRVFMPDESWKPATDAFVAGIACETQVF